MARPRSPRGQRLSLPATAVRSRLKSFEAPTVALCREFGATCPLGLVGPGPDGTPPTHFPCLDFLSWNVAHLGPPRLREPAMPLMAWTVRSREEADRAAEFAAQIVFEHFAPDLPAPA